LPQEPPPATTTAKITPDPVTTKTVIAFAAAAFVGSLLGYGYYTYKQAVSGS
jgi:hypothetical protein